MAGFMVPEARFAPRAESNFRFLWRPDSYSVCSDDGRAEQRTLANFSEPACARLDLGNVISFPTPSKTKEGLPVSTAMPGESARFGCAVRFELTTFGAMGAYKYIRPVDSA